MKLTKKSRCILMSDIFTTNLTNPLRLVFGWVKMKAVRHYSRENNGWFKCISYWNSPFLADIRSFSGAYSYPIGSIYVCIFTVIYLYKSTIHVEKIPVPTDPLGTKSQASSDREISAINQTDPDSQTHIEIQSLRQRIGGQAVLGPTPCTWRIPFFSSG